MAPDAALQQRAASESSAATIGGIEAADPAAHQGGGGEATDASEAGGCDSLFRYLVIGSLTPGAQVNLQFWSQQADASRFGFNQVQAYLTGSRSIHAPAGCRPNSVPNLCCVT